MTGLLITREIAFGTAAIRASSCEMTALDDESVGLPVADELQRAPARAGVFDFDDAPAEGGGAFARADVFRRVYAGVDVREEENGSHARTLYHFAGALGAPRRPLAQSVTLFLRNRY